MFTVSLVLISEMYIRELIKVYVDERAYIRNILPWILAYGKGGLFLQHPG